MAYENKPGNGALFKNDRKEKETHPDYRGDLNVDGRAYWLNAWVKSTKDGKKYFSVAVKPKEAREEKPQTLAQQRPNDFDDDKLPF
jgi:uncharacterized protein (DUF736 family)